MSLKEELKELKRPVSSWLSSVDRVKTPIFPTSRMEECRPVSSWPSSVDRVKTSIFPTSRMEECRPVSSWPSSVDRVKTPIFPTSRMEECRPVSSCPSSFDRVKTSIFPTSRMEEIARPVSSWPSSFDRDRCHLGLRRLIGSRHQSSRPQGWKSAVGDQQHRERTIMQNVSIFPQAAMKQTDWICQLNDFGRKGPESATTYYFRLKFCLIPSGIEFSSSGGIPIWRPSVQRSKFVIALQFGHIKIGAFWSLPDSRFSVMCKEGQL
ncbi:hypothetical protein GQ457_06G011570 [Hibiscus cannabinus]